MFAQEGAEPVQRFGQAFGLGPMELLVLLLCFGAVVAAIVFVVMLIRRHISGPDAGEVRALKKENQRLREELSRRELEEENERLREELARRKQRGS